MSYNTNDLNVIKELIEPDYNAKSTTVATNSNNNASRICFADIYKNEHQPISDIENTDYCFSGAIISKRGQIKYDNHGNETFEDSDNITTYIAEYKKDGTSKNIYTGLDGIKYEITFNDKGEEIGGRLSNGTKFITKLTSNGFKRIYTKHDNSIYEYSFNLRGQEIGGITSSRNQFVTNYDDEGNLIRNFTRKDNSSYSCKYNYCGILLSYYSENLSCNRYYNRDESYIDEYLLGEDIKFQYGYDKYNRLIFYKDRETSYFISFNEDNSFIKNYSRADGLKYQFGYNSKGQDVFYVDPELSYTKTHNPDGSITKIWSDGRTFYYDSHGREVGGEISNEIVFETKFMPNGCYERIFTKSNGEKYRYLFTPTNIEIGGMTEKGVRFITEYKNEGIVKRLFTRQDGYKYEYSYNIAGQIITFSDYTTSYIRHYNNDGSGKSLYTKDDQTQYEFGFNNESKITYFKSHNSSFVRKYNSDNSYTDIWNNNQIDYYDNEGNKIKTAILDEAGNVNKVFIFGN